MPPGPSVPWLASLSDGVHLQSGSRITSRSVKLFVEDLTAPDRLKSAWTRNPVRRSRCLMRRPCDISASEVSFKLPDSVTAGAHNIELNVGPAGSLRPR